MNFYVVLKKARIGAILLGAGAQAAEMQGMLKISRCGSWCRCAKVILQRKFSLWFIYTTPPRCRCLNEREGMQLKKLKIAMLGHKRIPSREGGVEVVVEELATRMVAQGHDVTCYNRKGHHIAGETFDNDEIQKRGIYKGVRLKQVWTINRRGYAAMTSSFFATVLVAFGRYDIVHFHAEGSCALLWLPKLCGKRCIVTVHGLDHQRAKWSKSAKQYIKLSEKIAVKFADEIIVLSKNTQEYFTQMYGRETVYIPNGTEAYQPQPADKIASALQLQQDGYILYLGRIVPEKGVEYLIKAFRKTNTDKKLVIAGSSSDTDRYCKQIRRLAKDDNRVVFVGFVQGQALAALYSNAYVYALPSDLEGMPLTVLEAMSYGNCCLVSDIPECTEVVGDKAVVFAQGNVEDLAQKLQLLCDDAALVQGYKAKSAAFICDKYSWDDVSVQTVRLYKNEPPVATAASQCSEVLA